MAIETRTDAVERLERLIGDTAGGVRKARLLAERVLHQLKQAAPPRLAPAPRRETEQEIAESDAESGWRLAA